MRTRGILLCLLLGAFYHLHGAAVAQVFPSRPVTIVVPFPAGGPLDTLVRVLAERVRKPLGQPIVIENVSGASGVVGVDRVVRAMPDGYTLSFGYLGTHVLNGAIFPLHYDLLTDLEPVAMLPSIPLLIGAKHALPPEDLRELIVWLKGNSNGALMATPGIGSPSHVMGVFLQNMAAARVQFVHYRGGGPALQDLIAGHVDLLVNQPSILLPHLQTGKIKVYAVLGKDRLSQAPEIPTADEQGFPDLQMSVWHGLWAPKGTPRSVVARLNAAVVEALGDATVRTHLAELGYETPPPERQTPEALGAFQKAEMEKWWPIIKAAAIKVE